MERYFSLSMLKKTGKTSELLHKSLVFYPLALTEVKPKLGDLEMAVIFITFPAFPKLHFYSSS